MTIKELYEMAVKHNATDFKFFMIYHDEHDGTCWPCNPEFDFDPKEKLIIIRDY